MTPEYLISDHKLFYLDQNPLADTVVLLLHGLGANSSSWAFQVPVLTAAGFRVLAPDARSFGQSTYPGRTSITEMSNDIVDLLHHLDIRSAHVVGISMGGALALQLALDWPELVDRLVLVNTFASLRPKNLKVWLYFVQRFFLVHTIGLKKQAEFVAKRIFQSPDQEFLRSQLISQISQANPQGYRATMRALARFDVTSRLGQVRSPTLVITGDHDTTVPSDVQCALAGGIPGAQHVVIPQAGHAVSVERPEVFNQYLMSFLMPELDRN